MSWRRSTRCTNRPSSPKIESSGDIGIASIKLVLRKNKFNEYRVSPFYDEEPLGCLLPALFAAAISEGFLAYDIFGLVGREIRCPGRVRGSSDPRIIFGEHAETPETIRADFENRNFVVFDQQADGTPSFFHARDRAPL
jgi:hypothetical protein